MPGFVPTFLAHGRGLAGLALSALFLGAVIDFITGSPGDAMLLLLAVAAGAFGLLLLSGHGLRPQIARLTPSVASRRPGAFALFALAAVAVFGKIAEDVVERESRHLDLSTTLFVHRFDTPLLDRIMHGFSFMGELPAIACIGIPVLAWCCARRDVPAFVALLGATAIDQVLKFGLKDLFGRARPGLFVEIPPLHSYSFPSGHAMAGVALYGTIAVVVGRLAPAARAPCAWAGAVIALLIGSSRVYLGAHWFTDVLGGYAVGAFILATALMWLEAYPPAASSTGADRRYRHPRPTRD